MTWLEHLIELSYVLAFVCLYVLALNSLFLSIASYARISSRRGAPSSRDEGAAGFDDHAPRVLIQLPVFNEPCVIERALSAISQIRYPSSRLEIQVLDDSTDETPFLVERFISAHEA